MPSGRNITGKEEVLAQLEALGRLDAAKDGLAAAAIFLKGKLSAYPDQVRLTRASVYGSTFKTDRQRRGFFAKLKAGEIEVPYHRGTSPGSERLKASWTTTSQDNGMTQVIGNDTSYGPWVMGDATQSIFMRALGWRASGVIMDESWNEAVGIVDEYIQAGLEG